MLFTINRNQLLMLLLTMAFTCQSHAQGKLAKTKVTIFAAVSLSDALTDIAKQFESLHSIKIQTSFSSSATVAKQISNGAPADIVMSADSQWMDYLQKKQRINKSSRVNLLGNRLVVIAPKGREFTVSTKQNFNFANAFKGKLCTGQTESVPAGIYAKQALMSLNWWHAIKPRLVGTRDVRATLAYVAHGECNAGIVYATDAKISNKVTTLAVFSKESHTPIVYPLALTNNAKPQAKAFYNYLKSKQAKVIFQLYGFNTKKAVSNNTIGRPDKAIEH